jgi:hypothetical protein
MKPLPKEDHFDYINETDSLCAGKDAKFSIQFDKKMKNPTYDERNRLLLMMTAVNIWKY